MARSPCRQAATTIVLPCIPEGVQAMPNLLGCVERLRYSDHDVADVDKFPEFARQVYLDSVGTGPFGIQFYNQSSGQPDWPTPEF
jgi:hypothetical protein